MIEEVGVAERGIMRDEVGELTEEGSPDVEDAEELVGARTLKMTGKVYEFPAASSAVTVTVTVVPTADTGAVTSRPSSFGPEGLAQFKSVLTITSVALLR